MDPIIGGALISAGSSLAGQLLGGSDDGPSVFSQVKDQINAKMAMADKYGISKLAMLGAPVTASAGAAIGDGWSQTLSSMGQDIGRAVAAKQTDAERMAGQLALTRAGLENDLLRAQITATNARTARESAPPLPRAARPGLVPEEVIPPTRTSGLNAGVGYETNPYVSDAQAFLNRYGDSELLAMLLNMGVGGADAYWQMRPYLDSYASQYDSALDAFLQGAAKRGMSIR